MGKELSDDTIEQEIAKTNADIQEEKYEKLIQLIVKVVVAATIQEFYETKEKIKFVERS